MLQDYAPRCMLAMGGRQKVAPRRKFGCRQKNLFWKISGLAVMLLMCIGVMTSYWIGWQIRSGLGELARAKRIYEEYSGQKSELVVRRGNLLAVQNFKAKAGKLGLFQPTDGQVRSP